MNEEHCHVSTMPIDVNRSNTYIGMYFAGDGIEAPNFWVITCPCGVTVKYPVNGIPEVDTQHPCGNANHWTVKYKAPK